MRKEDRHRVLRGGVIKCEEEEMGRESKIRETRGHGGPEQRAKNLAIQSMWDMRGTGRTWLVLNLLVEWI